MQTKRIFSLLLLITLCNSFEINKSTLRVFLIEINPTLKTLPNSPLVSDYFSHNKELALSEIIEDINFASHGQVTVDIVGHVNLEEFPTYTKQIKLLSGKYDYRLDEETYISISRSNYNSNKGDWFKLYESSLYNEIDDFNYDYEYLIEKYDLVSLKKRDMFDHVWILGVDPLSTYETMMVGSNEFWINGTPIKKDCKNFMIAGFSYSRRDSNLHRLSHSFEDLINHAHTGTFFTTNEEKNDYNQQNYDKLSYWEKFTLIDKVSKSQNSGVGNVHFPFNGEYDYDYSNTRMVYSNWESWLNYPNINGNKKQYNNNAWMSLPGNTVIINNPSANKNPDRLYLRFWLYLMPHIDGYTEEGYLNNWWDYYSNLDYATKIDASNKNVNGYIGKEIELNYNVYYRSGDIENVKYAKEDKNVKIDGDCVAFQDSKLIGTKAGNCFVSIYRDGKKVSFSVNILQSANIYMSKFLY